jgi:hypothetical protein
VRRSEHRAGHCGPPGQTCITWCGGIAKADCSGRKSTAGAVAELLTECESCEWSRSSTCSRSDRPNTAEVDANRKWTCRADSDGKATVSSILHLTQPDLVAPTTETSQRQDPDGIMSHLSSLTFHQQRPYVGFFHASGMTQAVQKFE